jgi:hypothetical protein
MGIMSFFADRERKAELRESKDEMLVGELVRAMSRKGWPSVGFLAHSDFQRLRFKTLGDPVFSHLYITLDRKTGSGALGEALLGSKATLLFTGEVKNYLADPDDLVEMYRTDLANLFKISWQDVRVNHEYNAILGTTRQVIEINNFVNRGPEGTAALVALVEQELHRVREKLRPFKKKDLL